MKKSKEIIIVVLLGVGACLMIANVVLAILQHNVHSALGWGIATLFALAIFIIVLMAFLGINEEYKNDITPSEQTMIHKGKKKDDSTL